MKFLDSLMITRGTEERWIELWQGDLTQMSPDEAVDVLVVSAIPNNYVPTERSLIGALYQKGVSVEELSRDKQMDLRDTCSCWLSKKIQSTNPGIQFKHILCFEPNKFGSPTDVVGDIFRSLVPFIIGEPHFMEVAMPLVSTGIVGTPIADMVDALFTASVHWLENGLPIKKLKIVEKSELKAGEIKGAFAILKKQYQKKTNIKERKTSYDIFLSYSHKNIEEANRLLNELKMLKTDIRIFIDRIELEPGVAWQEKLYQCIDDSKKVLAVYSPAYVKSKACQEEFNFASLLHSRSGQKFLFPVLLYDTHLLPQMSKWNYVDCKVADPAKMQNACKQLLQELSL
ncbi:MAG TPA: toll/interleukin-1 receptor domain-containing protein [Leptolinea sp.]